MALENIAQKTLCFAFEQANGKNKEYANFVKKAPSYIQNNGLLYTLAYIKDKEPKLFEHIQTWHSNKNNITNLDASKCKDKESFLKLLLDLPDNQIRLLTIETLSLLKCLKRFVKSDD